MSDDRTTLFEGTAEHPRHAGRHGGTIVAEALSRHGTDFVFTLCGGHVLPVLDGCIDARIRIVDTRHESAAAMAATGYAYAARRPGVCAITAGPGFTNAVTGIADANHSGVPLVVLAGRTPVSLWKRGAIQDIDQVGIAQRICKRANTCHAAERIEEYVADAFSHASTARQGAVYVEIPSDVLLSQPTSPLEWTPGWPERIAASRPADEAVVAALRLLEDAERPVVLCGSGAFWSRADDALADFAEATSIPVTTTGPSRGLLPDSHAACLGGLIHGGLAVLEADVVLVVGSRFDGNMLFGGPPLFHSGQKLIQVDVLAEGFGGNRAPNLSVQGDASAVLHELAEQWDAPRKDAWLSKARASAQASREGWLQREADEAEGVHPGTLARVVNEVVRERSSEATLVADGGDILTWAIAHFTAERPAGILTTGTSLGTLGVGLPFAIGAKAARPSDPAVLLTGDGTFGLSAMEIDTAARHGLPVVCVVSNNGAWGDVQYEQRSWFGGDRVVASGLGFTRYEKLAEMAGGFGAWVEDPAELRPAVEAALDSNAPAVVNVRTDPGVVSDVLRGIGQLGVM